jgi:hypothetical protein
MFKVSKHSGFSLRDLLPFRSRWQRAEPVAPRFLVREGLSEHLQRDIGIIEGGQPPHGR